MITDCYRYFFICIVLTGVFAACGKSDPVSPEPEQEEIIIKTFTLTGGATIEMIQMNPGTFMMGSPEGRSGGIFNPGPQHKVTITKGFYLGKYEVTQGQWESVMGTRPWAGKPLVQENPNHPAVWISWNDTQGFIQRLNEAAGSALYRLPTEAEWEYACRAGTTTRWSFGENERLLKDYAWYTADPHTLNLSEMHALRVGTKKPNPWGLHDMYGNVQEWCQDWYSTTYYSSSPAVDPQGATSGEDRVVRGGSFVLDARFVQSAARWHLPPSDSGSQVGFRLSRGTQ